MLSREGLPVVAADTHLRIAASRKVAEVWLGRAWVGSP
jgi:hypothetical protein